MENLAYRSVSKKPAQITTRAHEAEHHRHRFLTNLQRNGSDHRGLSWCATRSLGRCVGPPVRGETRHRCGPNQAVLDQKSSAGSESTAPTHDWVGYRSCAEVRRTTRCAKSRLRATDGPVRVEAKPDLQRAARQRQIEFVRGRTARHSHRSEGVRRLLDSSAPPHRSLRFAVRHQPPRSNERGCTSPPVVVRTQRRARQRSPGHVLDATPRPCSSCVLLHGRYGDSPRSDSLAGRRSGTRLQTPRPPAVVAVQPQVAPTMGADWIGRA